MELSLPVGLISPGCRSSRRQLRAVQAVGAQSGYLRASQFYLRRGLAPELVQVAAGSRAENHELLELRYDYIFFTGSAATGRQVMAAAARHLTPVTLELGGKSPAIVEKTADLDKTAKRILFGKLMNAGQTCVAPDYVHVERTVKAILIDKLLQGIENSLAADQDYYKTGYAKIISDEHFAHLQHLLHNQRLLCPAGRHHREDEATRRQMYPVLVDEPAWDSPLMQEEIFGPVLPVLSWNNNSLDRKSVV